MSVPIPITAALRPGESAASVVAFAQATRDRGHVTEQSFDNDTSSNGVAVGGEVIGKFGGGGK